MSETPPPARKFGTGHGSSAQYAKATKNDSSRTECGERDADFSAQAIRKSPCPIRCAAVGRASLREYRLVQAESAFWDRALLPACNVLLRAQLICLSAASASSPSAPPRSAGGWLRSGLIRQP